MSNPILTVVSGCSGSRKSSISSALTPDEIELRYYLGYEHLNKYWKYFDELYLFETSAYKEEPRLILTSIEDQVEREDKIPDYLNNLIPDILSER